MQELKHLDNTLVSPSLLSEWVLSCQWSILPCLSWHSKEEGRELQAFPWLSIHRLGHNPFLCIAWIAAALQSCFAQLGQWGWDGMCSYFWRF